MSKKLFMDGLKTQNYSSEPHKINHLNFLKLNCLRKILRKSEDFVSRLKLLKFLLFCYSLKVLSKYVIIFGNII